MLRYLPDIAVFAIGLLIGLISGGLVGEVGGTMLGAVAAVCKTIDTSVDKKLLTQDQANGVAQALLTELKVKQADMQSALSNLSIAPANSPCAIALASK
jgi:hypothetical protein